MSDLFDPQFLHQHIYPLALELSGDKVAEVRSSAGFLVSGGGGVFVAVWTG